MLHFYCSLTTPCGSETLRSLRIATFRGGTAMNRYFRQPTRQTTIDSIRSSRAAPQLRRLDPSETSVHERRRHEDFFPPGIGRREPFPNQPDFTLHPVTALYDKLLDRDRLRYTDKMLVTSAAYYKSKKKPGHELLLFSIADRIDEPLKNYILLDRTPKPSLIDAPAVSSSKPNVTQLLGGPASDQFCISYCGNRDSLLRRFGGPSLDELNELETLVFPSQSFYLYELIILAYVTSSDRPDYHLLRSQCYWFANTMWESMKTLVPAAIPKSHMSTRPQILGLNVIRQPSLVEDVAAMFRETRSAFRLELVRHRLVRRETRRHTLIERHRDSSYTQSTFSEASPIFPQAPQDINAVNEPARLLRTNIDEGRTNRSTRWWDLLPQNP